MEDKDCLIGCVVRISTLYVRVEYNEHVKLRRVSRQIGHLLVHLKYTLQNETHLTERKYWAENALFLSIFASEWTYLRH